MAPVDNEAEASEDRVVIEGIDIPMGELVKLTLKLTVASIPASILAWMLWGNGLSVILAAR